MVLPIWRILALSATALTCACASTPPSSNVALHIVEAPFQISGSHIALTVRAGGHDYPAVYDSGAEVSLMSATVAQALGVQVRQGETGHGFGGDIPSGEASNVRLEIGDGAYTFPSVAVVDFTAMLGPGADLGFLLGPTLLPSDVFEINPAAHRLRWIPQHQFRAPSQATAFSLGHQGGTYTIPVTINGVCGIAGIDLGSGTAIAVSHDYARRIGLAANAGATRSGTGVGGDFQTRVTSIPHVSVAGVDMTDVPIEIHGGPLPTEADINLGTPILFRFLIALDYANQRSWFRPIAGAGAAPFARDLTGMRTQRAGDRLTVSFVSDRGPAHAAGLVEGDQILAIDGITIASWPAGRPFLEGPAGVSHTLALADGRALEMALARYY